MVALQRADRLEQLRQHRGDHGVTLHGRQVRHVGRVGGEPREVVPGQLHRPEPGQPGGGHRVCALGAGEVGEVLRRLAATGWGEDELLGHGSSVPTIKAIRGPPPCAAGPGALCSLHV